MKQVLQAKKQNNKWILTCNDWKYPLANFSWSTRFEAYLGCKRLYPDGKRVHGGYQVIN